MDTNISGTNFKVRSNFGSWGWFTIIFAFFSFMFAGNLIVDGMNVTVGAFSALNDWKVGILLSYSTIAGLIAIFGCWVLSNCANRYGVKLVYCVSLAIVAVCCMFWGGVTQIWQYVVILILVNIFGNGFGFVGGTALLANWFPNKKGLAMGWATIGFQASPVLMLPVFSWLMAKVDLAFAYRMLGGCLFLMLLICILFVKNVPEERGCAPDNDWSHTAEEYKAMYQEALDYEKEHQLSTLQLLKMKQTWQIGIVNGLVQMAITVLIVQFIPNMLTCGFSPKSATLIYSAASIVGGVGSYLWGVLDQKIGVKKATVWMCIMHGAGGLIFAVVAAQMIPGAIVPVFGAFIVGSILGVSSNYLGSFTATVFGRYGYAKAFSVIYILVMALRSAGYALIGIVATATGSYSVPYVLAAVASVLAMLITFRIDDRCIDGRCIDQAAYED